MSGQSLVNSKASQNDVKLMLKGKNKLINKQNDDK